MIKGLVSVVIGVHNEKEEYLRRALDSIYNQTYTDIEIIIIDDASDEKCKNVLKKICDGRTNVQLVHNKENLGLTKSLNIGLQLCKGEYIARMDADDISMPERIAKQVDFLQHNPNIDIVGTGVVSFGDSCMFVSPAFGYTNDEAQCTLFFSSTLCHPSVMIRFSFLRDNHLTYDENFKKTQDYDLWERASVHGKLAVLREVLLYYRIHSAQITTTSSNEQHDYADKIRRRRIQRLGVTPTEEEYLCHKILCGEVNSQIPFCEVQKWVGSILSHNRRIGLVDQSILKQDLKKRLVLSKLKNPNYRNSIKPGDFITILSIFIYRIRKSLKLAKHSNII